MAYIHIVVPGLAIYVWRYPGVIPSVPRYLEKTEHRLTTRLSSTLPKRFSSCPKVLPHVEPPAASPIQQRDSIGIRDDAKQTVRHRTRDPHKLLLLRVSTSFRSLPRT